MSKQISGYEYPFGGYYNETVVIFADGTKANVCVQYASVHPFGRHADDCEQITKMGGRCTCGKLDDIDIPALLADAKVNGKFGEAPKPEPTDADYAEAARVEAEYQVHVKAVDDMMTLGGHTY